MQTYGLRISIFFENLTKKESLVEENNVILKIRSTFFFPNHNRLKRTAKSQNSVETRKVNPSVNRMWTG